jgi:hypothetical protein
VSWDSKAKDQPARPAECDDDEQAASWRRELRHSALKASTSAKRTVGRGTTVERATCSPSIVPTYLSSRNVMRALSKVSGVVEVARIERGVSGRLRQRIARLQRRSKMNAPIGTRQATNSAPRPRDACRAARLLGSRLALGSERMLRARRRRAARGLSRHEPSALLRGEEPRDAASAWAPCARCRTA